MIPIILFLTALIHFCIAATVFLSNPLRRQNIVFALFDVLIGMWTLLNGIVYLPIASSYTLFWAKTTVVCAFFFPGIFLYLSYIFPNSKNRPTWRFFFLHLPCILTLFSFLPSKNFIFFAQIINSHVYFGFGYLYAVLCIYVIGTLLLGVFNLAKQSRVTSSSLFKRQIGYVTFGVAISVVIGLIFSFILPFLGYSNYIFVSPLGTVFIAGFWGYVIVKHELIDIRIVIGESLSWLLTLATMAGILISAAVALWFNPYYAVSGVIITSLFLALIASWCQKKVVTGYKYKFIKGYYDPQVMLNEATQKLATIGDRKLLLEAAESIFDKHMEFEQTAILYPIRNLESDTIQYVLSISYPNNSTITRTLSFDHELINFFKQTSGIQTYENLSQALQEQLETLHIDRISVFLIFKSIEGLEGVLVLGERSGNLKLKVEDLQFLTTLQNFIESVLHRLIPQERIEKYHKKTIELSMLTKTMITVNHEINNPLTTITLAATQLIKQPLEPEKSLSLLKLIESQAKRIAHVLKALRKITDPIETDYLPGVPMLKIDSEEINLEPK